MQNWKIWCGTFLSPFLLREQLSIVNFKWSKQKSKVLHWFSLFVNFPMSKKMSDIFEHVQISIPLSELINESLSTGCFLNICKTAKVIPIFKTKSRVVCNNYRPIFLLSNISKIIEKIMHQRLNKFLEETNCFYNLQFGFHLNLSTNTALLSIIENIQIDLDNRDFAAGVFIDLKKAFGTVVHHILLKKAWILWCEKVIKRLVPVILKNRKQFKLISNSTSNTKEITTSVPQGSVLGSLLFVLYINDLHRSIKHSKTYHFADNVNPLIYYQIIWTKIKKSLAVA